MNWEPTSGPEAWWFRKQNSRVFLWYVEVFVEPKMPQGWNMFEVFFKIPQVYIWPKCVLIAAKSASNTPCGICEKHPNLWNIFGFKQILQKYPTQVYFWIEYTIIPYNSNISQTYIKGWGMFESKLIPIEIYQNQKYLQMYRFWRCQMYSWMISKLFWRCQGGIFGDVRGVFLNDFKRYLWRCEGVFLADFKGYFWICQGVFVYPPISHINRAWVEGSESSYW